MIRTYNIDPKKKYLYIEARKPPTYAVKPLKCQLKAEI